ncbi:CPBP family intramembrane metalloprotease [Lactobacillus sp. LC28-10]|uniref:CPBP family intramembrane metalloprotease n=1 Tax=Secundilactobacillus angelensis TaxID=2722706 RepID=A0ABX1L0S9_9LACO|nr:CPBP family intramembrane glutamic endopeptidase [Secundilactobacillus angelensis]MCH5462311.1 CPBP family intramembrane metalloprotease [Secundilactobacillus angelensis]NLR19050.1 CPBP family intramembrane metalloprotease [Secundilactobacillus angelensis]
MSYIKRQGLRIGAFVLLLAVYLSDSILLELATKYANKNAALTDKYVGAMLIMAASVLVLYTWLYHRQLKQYNPRHFGHQAFNWHRITQLLLAFILMLAVQIAWSQLITHHLLPMPSNQSALDGEIQQLPLWNTVYGVLFAPVFEEYLFRGLFFNFFFSKNSLWSNLIGVFVSGLIFGYLHTMAFSVTTLFYASLGWVLAGTYLYFKDIRYSITLHFLNNLWAVV